MIKIFCDEEIVAYIDNEKENPKLVRTDSKKNPPMGLFNKDENEVGFDKFYNWIVDRAFPEERIGAEELLAKMNLKKYNPIDIVKITNARQFADSYWVEWS